MELLLKKHPKVALNREERNYLRRHSSRLLSTLSLVKSLPITSILDVGSGGGFFLLLVPQEWSKVAVDSPLNAELVSKRGIHSSGLDLEEEAFPFEDNTFDLVTLLEVIEHIRNKSHVFSEIYRVLRQNGLLVVTTPDARNPFWWLRDRILEAPGIGEFVFALRTGRLPGRQDAHRGCLAENDLAELITSGGFVIVGRRRFKIFQSNDDLVLIGRKHSEVRKVVGPQSLR